ncbi:excinuclease ATPase subunit [Rubrivivax gelatinosus]|uniref:Excinuclease ATPase subunit n=1 Tax=Rubrivivax gelatinosus TaxID=28068 RepID=A0ABS1DQW6_RUBGE|nr:excinuclease ATPase subunit [Rubrivivax gelatinosus]MBK1612141.1 excinuclease ATPase subunit [Rubrivivax gelatinosus]MBK1711197.1 excinuclease ATPase subunit [Rubrivivax gelatinosus]MBZ8143738.1 excinuclease ATPase subunit [Rubrivivax gelatinosus]
MKKLLLTAVLAACAATPALARDTEHKLSLEDVLAMPEAQGKLDGSVKFYLKGQKTPKVLERKGEGVSNRKTNAFNKTDLDACRWTALSVLMAFQESAKRAGANAVVDIVSYYKKDTEASATDFECHAGAFVAAVALKGTYAKVAD